MSRIVRFEVGRFDYDLMGEFKFFKTPVRPSIVVRLTDENDVQSWGQSVPVETWTYETVETTLRHNLAPVILGAEPSDSCGNSRTDGSCNQAVAFGWPAGVQSGGGPCLLRPVGQADQSQRVRDSRRCETKAGEAQLDRSIADDDRCRDVTRARQDAGL